MILSFKKLLFLGFIQFSVSTISAQTVCQESAEGVPPPVALVKVASGFDAPLQVTQAGDNSGRLFVTNKMGTIQILDNGQVLLEPFLDLSHNLATDNEQGLLSLAFHPKYSENGRFFVFYTRNDPFSSVISEFQVHPENPNIALKEERIILEVSQAEASTMHRAGQLQFGPEGYLYASLGDAGYSNLAQRLDNLNGKIIRIDINGDTPYNIPEDNPFRDKEAKPEIWAYGFRNPWRFTFDKCSGRLFTGDVGSTRYEEVNLVEQGGNYGWSFLEASRCRDNRLGYKCGAGRFKAPIHEYAHFHIDPEGGLAVVGGYVYRGQLYPSLQGRYFFADMTGRIWTLTEKEQSDLAGSYQYWHLDEVWQGYGSLVSFGEDESGELYLTNLSDKALYQLRAQPLDLAEADLISTNLPQSIALAGWGEVAGKKRWSFGESSTITFHVEKAQKLWLKFNFNNPFPSQTLTIKFNGKEIAKFEGLSKNQGLAETLPLEVQKGTNQLSFHYKDWNGYLTILENGDTRPLALRFERLQLLEVLD